ncbi:1-deoxy-D-xylulose-5-phosphate reductoisomerase, partial [bacterium]|nr:1-deoxy-D-xylulose-5-phosphate reductoisomerase [bacterium]
MKNIIVLGSTGTVGKNVLEVVKERASEWKVLGIACRNNKDMFAEQIQEFKPEFAYIQDID